MINDNDNDTKSIAGSVPGMVTTNTETNHHAAALAATQAQNQSLKARNSQLAADVNTANQRNQFGGGDARGRGRDRGRGRGRGGRTPRVPRPPRPYGILGAYSDTDKRLTRVDDGRLEKFYQNQDYCHTHWWDVSEGHTSATCMYPDMCHESTATAENPMGGC